jgi:hypothetical protein
MLNNLTCLQLYQEHTCVLFQYMEDESCTNRAVIYPVAMVLSCFGLMVSNFEIRIHVPLIVTNKIL